MKGLLSYKNVLFLICGFLFFSCSKELEFSDIIVQNGEKEILEFTFRLEENGELDTDITANIDQENRTVSVVLPYGTAVRALKPTIIVSDNASIAQNTAISLDFSEPVVYSVIAEDGTITDYTVRVRVVASTQREILLKFYEDNPDNTLGWDIASENIASWDGVTVVDNKVVALDFTEKGLTVLPPEICDLFYLRTLVLETNMIAEIPVEIEDLSNNLRTMNLGNNQIERIPEEFFSLNKMIELEIYSNSLTELPSGIGNLNELIVLSISNNEIIEIPVELFELTTLNELHMNNIGLTQIPEEISNLTRLTTLRVSNNPIGLIPDVILNLESLINLDLRNTGLLNIPQDIDKLSNLERLELSINQLITIPENMGNLFRLKTLFLDRNTIEEIPIRLSNLINLNTLDVTENLFTTIPNAVCDLANTGTEVLIDENVTCEN